MGEDAWLVSLSTGRWSPSRACSTVSVNSSGDYLTGVLGPLEGLGHGAIVVGDEIPDLGNQVIDRGERAVSQQFPHED